MNREAWVLISVRRTQSICNAAEGWHLMDDGLSGALDRAREHLVRTIDMAEEEGTWRTGALDRVRALLAKVDADPA